jgi:EAL domain-containing protein (putative c-di-GMP-specific phosphodiesterase class I)
MAHHLGLEVVAEGLETIEVLRLLEEMDCDLVQGYLLAKPMSALALSAFVAREAEHTAALRETRGAPSAA